MLKKITTLLIAATLLITTGTNAEMGKDCKPCGKGCWRWEPPKHYVRFRRCYYGCPAVETCGKTHWVLPCATTACTSYTQCSMPTTGVAPPVTVYTATSCSKCSVTVNPLRCTTVVVCNPARTSCAASYASVSSMTFSTITSAVTITPSDDVQQGAAVASFDPNVSLWIAIAIASVAFFGILA